MSEDENSIQTEAVVTDVRYESPTVKGLTLRIEDPRFHFKAGQWVDFFIPGIETIAGYSMCSSPKQLEENRTLDLAIQYSDWPPTFWVHDKCQVNSTIEVRVGGKNFFHPEEDDCKSLSTPKDLLLVAGGVGINPLASMFFHANDLHKGHTSGRPPGKVVLLQSAKSTDELLFKSKLDALSEDDPRMEVRYFVTRERPVEDASSVTYGRIKPEVLRTTVESLSVFSLTAYVCGPAKMIDEVEEVLLDQGLAKDQIMYEKWW